jgi:hypothetical protein
MSTYKIIRLKVTQNEHLQKNIVGPTAAFSFLAVPFRRATVATTQSRA